MISLNQQQLVTDIQSEVMYDQDNYAKHIYVFITNAKTCQVQFKHP